MDKRSFLKNAGLLGVGGVFGLENLAQLMNSVSGLPISDIAEDEDFWAKIRGEYLLKPDYINLENGYYCFLPQVTLENFIRHMRE
jgi:hypothetical protein